MKRIFRALLVLLLTCNFAFAQQLQTLDDTDSLKQRRVKTNDNFTLLQSLVNSRLPVTLSNPANGQVIVMENGVWKNKSLPINGSLVVEAADGSPSYGLTNKLIFDETDGFTLSSSSAGSARIDLQVPWSKVTKSASDVITALGPTPAINCSACTGFGATGGITNTGSTTVGADTNVDGSGVIDLQTRGVTRLRIENAGALTAADASGLANLNYANLSSDSLELDRSGHYYLRSLQATLSKIARGTDAIANILFIGDSITIQEFVTDELRQNLQAQFGDAGKGYVRATSDATNAPLNVGLTTSGTWTERDESSNALGLHCNDATSSDTGTPASKQWYGGGTGLFFTDAKILYAKKNGGGSFRWRVDSGSWTTVNTANATTELGMVTITGQSTAAHTLTLEVTAAGTTGVTVLNADFTYGSRGVKVHNVGNTGSKASQFAAQDESIQEAEIAALNPTVIFLEFGQNEAGLSESISTYITSHETLIARFRAAAPLADIVLVGPYDKGASLPPGAQMIDYNNAVHALARLQGVGWLDWYKPLGLWDDADARGLMDDAAHVSRDGGRLLAEQTYSYLTDGMLAPFRGGTFNSEGLRIKYDLVGGGANGGLQILTPDGSATLGGYSHFGTDIALRLTANASGIKFIDSDGNSFMRMLENDAKRIGVGTDSPSGHFHVLSSFGGFAGIITQSASGQSASTLQVWDSDSKPKITMLDNRLRIYNLSAVANESPTDFEYLEISPQSNVYTINSVKGGSGTRLDVKVDAPNVLATGILKLGSAPTTINDSAGKILSAALNTVQPAQGGLGTTSTPSNGALPIGNGTNFTLAPLTAGGGISITNGAGSIAVATTGEQLLQTATVNASVGTKQNIYTVPAGKHAVITRVVARNASTSLSSIVANLTFGFDGSALDYVEYFKDSQLQSLTSGSLAIVLINAGGAGTGSPIVIGAATDRFGCIFDDTSLSATLVIDVYGYLY